MIREPRLVGIGDGGHREVAGIPLAAGRRRPDDDGELVHAVPGLGNVGVEVASDEIADADQELEANRRGMRLRSLAGVAEEVQRGRKHLLRHRGTLHRVPRSAATIRSSRRVSEG